MHTLALPMLLVNQARAIACGLCLACTTLAPRPSHAFTYDVLASPVIVQHQSTGTPLVWPTTPIAIRLELGDAGRRLLNGTTSWDENAATAIAAWNAVLPIFVQQSTASNVVRWANPDAGEHLGASVATTHKEYGMRDGTMVLSQAAVLLNPTFCWDAYDGPLRQTCCNGRIEPRMDIQRIILHELGHVLGLEHPDEGGQDVAAIMNHTTSDLDTLQADDEAGIHGLYPPQSVAAQRQDVSAAAAEGGPGGGGGCAMGTGAADGMMALVALVIFGPWLRSRLVSEEGHKQPSHQGVQEP